jgi:imidazolonepropionase-like amidohydrolase
MYGGLVGLPFDTAGDFYALVKEAKAQKADFIKLMISGIMDFQSFGGLSGGGLEPEEIPELIRIAHGEGFRVMAHANGAQRVKAALRAGLDSVEHGYFLDDECLSLMKETGAVWVPTLAATAGFAGRGGFAPGVAEENIRHACENLRKARALGVLVASGSDAGAVNVPPDTGIHLECALLAAAGFTAEELRRGNEAVRRRFVREGP